MAKEVCKIFQDVDEYFVNNKPDFDKINKIGNYMQDCYDNNPSEPHKCKDDLQGIKVLCSYIFTELHKISKDIQKRENNDNQYVEYAMMWLGYRLFQEESYSSSTLSNFYNNDLMKSDLFNNYTDLIKKKEHLKDVNLYYMKRLYELFKEVCYMTLKYSKNNLDMKKIQRNFNTFQNKYRNLYNNIEECNSYLILLNSIKVAYGHFRKSLITSIPKHKIKELHSNLKDLTPRIKVDKVPTPRFNSRECKNVNSKAAKKPYKAASNVPKAKPAESSQHPHQSQKPEAPPTKPATSDEPPSTSPQKVLPAAPQISQPQVQLVPAPEPPANPESVKPKTDASSQQAGQQSALPPVPSTEQQSPKLQPTAPSSEPQRAASPETQPPISDTTTQKGSPDSQGLSNSGAGQLPNQENTSKGSDSDQHNSAGQIKEQGGNTADKPERPQDGQQENSGSKQANSIDVPKNGTQMKASQLNDPLTSIKSPNQGGAPGDPKKTETGDKHSSPTLPQIKGQQAESSSPAPSAMPIKESKNDNSQQSHQITDSHIPGGIPTPSDSESKDTGNIKKPQENKQGTIGDEQKDSGGGIGNESSPQSDPSNPSHSNSHPLTSGTNQRNSDDGSVGGSEHTNDGTGSQGSIDSGSDSQGSTDSGSGGNGSDGSDSGTGGGPSDGPGSTGDGKDSGGGNPGSGANGGSKAPGDQGVTDPSGNSDGGWLGNWEINFNPMSYIPSVSDIYETPKNILASTANKITSAYSSTVDNIKYAYDRTVDSATNAYNSTMIVVKDTYNSTMTNITNAYTTSTNYISGAVSSITNQLSSLGSFSQLGNDQPALGGSGNNLPTDNNSLKTPKTPNSDHNPLPLPPSLPSPLPQYHPPSVTLPPSQTLPPLPSQLQQIKPQNMQVTNLQPLSGSTQDSSQITNQNGGSNPVQSHDTKPLTVISQTTNYSTGPSSTGSGITTGTDVKMNEKSSIWCIASNKKCGILGIGIISISIFAFLTIMYKYISFGSSKKSEKKNMKRVIKLVDGNKKTQIIIKSYDRNKHLKPIINSVGRKKDPLLNIYKLMQADPVPFINLFFLLIFFVYKRQLNYLEL
ncbi:PIR protein CIR protein [Plasmodium vinckei brucechwatti]|uniref:PIR protein CIR protein n=1 Tax=Plasmodium vinckei brucechwatti TaxID=119398 RepID=A0A6V7RW30_PLAVN|nr:PIR protein CIR protein [Plasmodium vinckei brucechwatti]